MKAYIAYSREDGPHEAAYLVIASNSRQAKKLAWKSRGPFDFHGFVDCAVKLIKEDWGLLLANRTKLVAGEPHVIHDPPHCKACGFWGAGLTTDGLCGNCNRWPGNEFFERSGHGQ